MSAQPTAKRDPSARRRVELARIHLSRQQLGFDEELYRDVLDRLTGKRSAAELDAAERARVLDYLSVQLGKKRAPRVTYPGRPHNIESPSAPLELRKIEAFLAEARRPWSYADAIARRVAKVSCCAFLDAPGARKVLAALTCDARRHGRPTSR